MRSLFHFPFPAQPPSQQPSHCSQKCAIARILHPCAASAAPQFCFPPPARSPVPRLPDPGPLSPAPRAPAMPRPHPCLAPPPAPIAPHHLSTAPLRPHQLGSPRPHRICPTACRHPHPPMSPPSRFRAHRPPSRPSCAAAVLHVLRFAVRIAPTVRRHPRHPPISLLALRRPQGPGWQESHRMHPLLAECAKKAPFLAASARNACFSGSRWQHPRPMHPFPGAIGQFGMHGARILPPRALFRVEEPEITHGAKMLPAPPGLSPAAACGPAERALRPTARAWPACRMRPPPSRPRSSPPSYTRRASPSETRHAVPVPMHLATCAPHPSRQPRAPTASRKQAEQRKQLNAGIKIGSPNGDPIEEFFGFAQRLPDALQPLHQANELALSYLDHSTRQRLGGYVIGLSGNSFTVDLYAALVDHATSIAR